MNKIELAEKLVEVAERKDTIEEVKEYIEKNVGEFDDCIISEPEDDWMTYYLDKDNKINQGLSEGNFIYRSTEQRNMLDVIEDGTPVIHFTCSYPTRVAGCVSYWNFSKQVFTGEYAIDEVYHPRDCYHPEETDENDYTHFDKSIVAKVFTRDEFEYYLQAEMGDSEIEENSDDDFLYHCKEGRRLGGKPIASAPVEDVIVVREVGNNTYLIEDRTDKGEVKSSKEVTGSSLYSVYYSYMVEKGYFSSNQRKYERNRK